MAVMEGSYVTQLAKSGSTFYIYYSSAGYDNKLQLGEYYSGQFTPMYVYKQTRY
jgi:hypothetical protein